MFPNLGIMKEVIKYLSYFYHFKKIGKDSLCFLIKSPFAFVQNSICST